MTDHAADVAAFELAYDKLFHGYCIFNRIPVACRPECRVCGIERGWRDLAQAVYSPAQLPS